MKIKLLLLISLFAVGNKVCAQQSFPFADEIKVFKHQDSLNFPKPGGILFIGSSSIRFWSDLEQRFPNAPIVKRGVGGSELTQWVAYYLPFVVYPHKIFVYAGENDIAKGRSALLVADDFSKLWEMIRHELPDAEIYWLAMKQSPIRAKYYTEVTKVNQLIKDFMANKSKTYYVDFSTPIWNDKTSTPDSSLFKADYLHLNSKGYDKWQVALAPYMK